MTPRRLVVAVLLVVLSTTCRTTPGVRLDKGQGQPLIQLPHTGDSTPVELGKEELVKAIAKEVRRLKPPASPEKAARDLFDIPPRSVAGTGTTSSKVSSRWTLRHRLRSGPRWLRE